MWLEEELQERVEVISKNSPVDCTMQMLPETLKLKEMTEGKKKKEGQHFLQSHESE